MSDQALNLQESSPIALFCTVSLNIVPYTLLSAIGLLHTVEAGTRGGSIVRII